MTADGRALAAWQDKRNGDEDIYFAMRSFGTETWSVNRKLNDDQNWAMQSRPAIAARGSALFVAWGDNRQGADDIYGTGGIIMPFGIYLPTVGP